MRQRTDLFSAFADMTDVTYARELEQFIYMNTETPYRVKAMEILTNLKTNLSYLYTNFSPKEVVTMKTADLCQSTKKAMRQTHIESDFERHQQILKEGVQNVDKLQASVGLLTCSKCKGTQISTELKQTRSADEGMSVFALCLQCKARWKM